MHDALSAWCDTTQAMCELTADQQRRRFCIQTTCSPPSCAVWDAENSCTGRSISFIIGGDVYGESYHYDGSGQLVAVEVQRIDVQRPVTSCIHTVDVFGTPCKIVKSNFADCTDVADAGS